jgi:hypothetical protein
MAHALFLDLTVRLFVATDAEFAGYIAASIFYQCW